MRRVLHVKKRSAFIWRVYLVGLSGPPQTPPQKTVAWSLSFCVPSSPCCISYTCASVIAVQPGRQLLSSALPLETLPCRLEEWNGCYGCCGRRQCWALSWLESVWQERDPIWHRCSCSLYSAGSVTVASLLIFHELYDVYRNRMWIKGCLFR